MSRNTMGEFLQALRKANGLTQKELADKLNVTDKAVSRWERDESYPDLTLIPILANIYHVSSDEILRGEKATEQVEETTIHHTAKSQKQLHYLAQKQKSKFNALNMISIGLLIIGFLAAFICNAANFAYVGFIFAIGFSAAAVISEIIVTYFSLLATSTDDFESAVQNDIRKRVFITAARIISCAALALIFFLPLVILPQNFFQGLKFIYLLLYGCLSLLIGCIPTFILYRVALYLAVKKGVFTVTEKERKRLFPPLKKYLHQLIFTGVTLLLIGAIQLSFNILSSKQNWFLEIKSFTEKPFFLHYVEGSFFHTDDPVFTIPLYDENGNLVVRYRLENQEIGKIWVEKDGERITYMTATKDALRKQNTIVIAINIGIVVLYIVDIVGVILYSVHKNKKEKKALEASPENEKESAA